jgi:hypothetical protein
LPSSSKIDQTSKVLSSLKVMPSIEESFNKNKNTNEASALAKRAEALGELEINISETKHQAQLWWDDSSLAGNHSTLSHLSPQSLYPLTHVNPSLQVVLMEEVVVRYDIQENEINESKGFRVKFTDSPIDVMEKQDKDRIGDTCPT